MSKLRATFSYEKMEQLTRKWWFYLLLFLVPLILPPITTKGFGYIAELKAFIWYVGNALALKTATYESLMPAFHVAVAVLIVILLLVRKQFGRIFSLIVGLHFLFITFVQTLVVTPKYGLVIVTEIFVWFLIAGLAWLWEAAVNKTTFAFQQQPWVRYWVVPMAIFSFWDPDQPWVLDPGMLLNSTAPIAFCMMTTIYLAALCLQYPKVNLPMFRVVSFVSVIVAIVTLGVAVVRGGTDGIYWTLIHLPMLATSLYCFVLSMRSPDTQLAESERA